MASTFQFCEDNGAAVGNPARGTTRLTGVGNYNLKSADDTSTAYSDAPITAGNASYNKYQFGLWTGTFNEISSVKINHVSGVFGAGLSLKVYVSGSGIYTTPSQTVDTRLIHDLSNTGLVSTGLAVLVGANEPQAEGKAASTASNPALSQYILYQLQTTVAAAPGDTATYTTQIQWTES